MKEHKINISFPLLQQRFLTSIRRIEAIDAVHAITFDQRVGDIYEEIFYNPNSFINVSALERELKKESRKVEKYDIDNNFNSIHLEYVHVILKKIKSNEPVADNAISYLSSFKEIESIDAKNSFVFKNFPNIAGSSYKGKLKSIARINEDLTALKYLLDIKE